MKNYFKKFSIMFVMALILMLGCCVNAFADSSTQSIKINNTTLSFNKIVYVDSNNGNDTTGDGNEINPYKTLKMAESNVNSGEAIVFKGNFTETKKTFKSGISYIGYEKESVINTCQIQGTNVNLYRFVINANNIDETWSVLGRNFNLYNIVYTNQYSSDGSKDIFYLYTGRVSNCLFGPGNWNNFTYDSCSVTNKDTACTSGYFNLKNVTMDSNYNITSSGWKNAGTGTNPDGTQANIGVYGGEFAWGNWNNQSITLDKSTMDLNLGDSDKLTATTTPASVGVTWKSSDTSVATIEVDPTNGKLIKVNGIKEGTCTITATTADGSNLSASCTINVTKKTDPIPTPDPQPIDTEYITNIAHAKGTNTNNPGGEVTIIFHGSSDTTLSLLKTADVKDVWIGDNFTYTLVITNTGTKTAKAVVVNDPAPNHIDFNVSGVTTTQGTVDSSSTSKNIIVNVGDIPPAGIVTIKIPATVIA
ncbi:Ig-like domain-containing protein [Clostridium sp. YIM B02555]|uniref:Ig-like domain-containing protein n=1 Tax=Clostridium sp. YIM B02555 TaxID=2911968 RepID=UPI001EED8966|nr:Ig-like domain-containing protein [Clostridium sp. YIM B02555]